MAELLWGNGTLSETQLTHLLWTHQLTSGFTLGLLSASLLLLVIFAVLDGLQRRSTSGSTKRDWVEDLSDSLLRDPRSITSLAVTYSAGTHCRQRCPPG